MAGSDWVKMRTDLYRDPKVCMMADLLMSPEGELARHVERYAGRYLSVTRNVMRNVTVGALVSVWGVLRHQGKREGDDLVVRGCTISVIDDIADLPGFGHAMASVGWAIETPEGFTLPRFFDGHNADPDEVARKRNAERQKRFRENGNALRNVTSNVTSNAEVTHRIEKNRDREEIYRGRNSPITPSYPETENPSSGSANPPEPNPAQPAPAHQEATQEPSLLEFPCDGAVKTWHLTQAALDQLKFAHPSLDVLGECRKALLWVSSDSGRKKTAKGMLRFLAGWMGRAQDRGAGRVPVAAPPARESREDIIRRLCANDPLLGGKR